jgi:sterol desaturase/sphingolipid hydroxylase (fatty acid hydroxylase superfamily)
MMNHLPSDPSRDAVPIRLFKSDFMEFFTHISPVTIVVIWLPLALYLGISALARSPAPASVPNEGAGGSGAGFVAAAFVLGLFLWTFAEYTLHRFLFHHKPTSPQQERIFFLFHGIHHAQPQVKTRLVMPLPVSIPAALISWGLFYLIFGIVFRSPQWVAPLMSGFLIGYLAYDLIHYATHHFPMRSGYGKFIKRHHMQHHYKDAATRFGVSSPLWDYVFLTQGA